MSRMVCDCHGFIYDSDFHEVCPMCEAEPVEATPPSQATSGE